jgi:hypothetical protein
MTDWHHVRVIDELACRRRSDAHDPEGIGAAYLEMPDFDGPREFLTQLPRGSALTGGPCSTSERASPVSPDATRNFHDHPGDESDDRANEYGRKPEFGGGK